MSETSLVTNSSGITLVRYWDIYNQQWKETWARAIGFKALATMTDAERDLISAQGQRDKESGADREVCE